MFLSLLKEITPKPFPALKFPLIICKKSRYGCFSLDTGLPDNLLIIANRLCKIPKDAFFWFQKAIYYQDNILHFRHTFGQFGPFFDSK